MNSNTLLSSHDKLRKLSHYKHFNKRLKERYHFEITKSEYLEIKELIQSKDGVKYSLSSVGDNDYYMITIKGYSVIVVYDKKIRSLVTAIPNYSTHEPQILSFPPYLATMVFREQVTTLYIIETNHDFSAGKIYFVKPHKSFSEIGSLMSLSKVKIRLSEVPQSQRKWISIPENYYRYTLNGNEIYQNGNNHIKLYKIDFILLGLFQDFLLSQSTSVSS